MALGAASLEVWAKAAAKANSLDRSKVAGMIRGQDIPGTIFGTARFAANGQMEQHYSIFTVRDGRIAVES
jgi:branched-chain amino acid transport system substrate-binding protein